jgi:hypothetical protein
VTGWRSALEIVGWNPSSSFLTHMHRPVTVVKVRIAFAQIAKETLRFGLPPHNFAGLLQQKYNMKSD